MKETNKYRMRYLIECGEFTKADRPTEEYGLTDSLLLMSVLHYPDGSSSHAIASRDGRTQKPFSANETFKAWSILTCRLANDPELGEGRRTLCALVFEIIRSVILGEDPSPELKQLAEFLTEQFS